MWSSFVFLVLADFLDVESMDRCGGVSRHWKTSMRGVHPRHLRVDASWGFALLSRFVATHCCRNVETLSWAFNSCRKLSLQLPQLRRLDLQLGFRVHALDLQHCNRLEHLGVTSCKGDYGLFLAVYPSAAASLLSLSLRVPFRSLADACPFLASVGAQLTALNLGLTGNWPLALDLKRMRRLETLDLTGCTFVESERHHVEAIAHLVAAGRLRRLVLSHASTPYGWFPFDHLSALCGEHGVELQRDMLNHGRWQEGSWVWARYDRNWMVARVTEENKDRRNPELLLSASGMPRCFMSYSHRLLPMASDCLCPALFEGELQSCARIEVSLILGHERLEDACTYKERD